MSAIEFSAEEKEIITTNIQQYFSNELNQDLGSFDAQFLLDFFSEEVGSYFYNRGLYDAQALLQQRMDDLSESIYELEKPTSFQR